MAERTTHLQPAEVFNLEDCQTAARLAKAPEIAERLHEYVSSSSLWPKLVNRAQTKVLGRFIINGLLLPVAYELVRAARQNRQPNEMVLARCWRRCAAQSSEGKGHEISECTPAELLAWLPQNQVPMKPRRVMRKCAECPKTFWVVEHSNQVRCLKHRLRGMAPGRTRSSKTRGLEAA
jgi:hypothetical protein